MRPLFHFHSFAILMTAFALALLACGGQPESSETGEPSANAALRDALTFHASYENGPDGDFALGDRRLYSAPSYKEIEAATPGLLSLNIETAVDEGKFGHALRFKSKNTEAVFYYADKNVAFVPRNWSGTISFWLNLNPDEDLAPGFCDPIQITDSAYNDSAIWVDFTKDDKPRHFRLGVFGDLTAWNPENIEPDKNPAFANRLVVVTQPPFSRGKWTHVAITHEGLGSATGGWAKLYLDGELQGTAEGITEAFSWDMAKGVIRIGVNYVGLFDELALFNRPLRDEEIRVLHGLRQGVVSLRTGG